MAKKLLLNNMVSGGGDTPEEGKYPLAFRQSALIARYKYDDYENGVIKDSCKGLYNMPTTGSCVLNEDSLLIPGSNSTGVTFPLTLNTGFTFQYIFKPKTTNSNSQIKIMSGLYSNNMGFWVKTNGNKNLWLFGTKIIDDRTASNVTCLPNYINTLVLSVKNYQVGNIVKKNQLSIYLSINDGEYSGTYSVSNLSDLGKNLDTNLVLGIVGLSSYPTQAQIYFYDCQVYQGYIDEIK